jgi:2-methylcitrate dehydratase PrpD
VIPSSNQALTRRLAQFLAAATYSDLPIPVIEETKRAVLDWLGSALAGSLEPPARMARDAVATMGSAAAAVAFTRGVASHILELDDIHKTSTVHAGAPVISAALAVAEREHADGRAFLLAVALGYEAALRIGEAVNPSHYRYWHPTGTAATFGAAAAAGSLLKLNAAQMLDALGSAGTQAAGLWEFNADGAMSKHLHPGKAAMNGVLAADLARVGFTGAIRILEGERGFFRAMSSSYDESRVTDGLGERWKISENCYKLHSCCGHTHTAIDLAQWRRPPGLRGPADILSIHIETYSPGYEIVREMNPRTSFQAKFSIAYCVAVALLDGHAGLGQFTPERMSDPAIAALLALTRVSVAEDLTAKYPAAWPARLTITLVTGETLHGAADFPRGNPENPITTQELEDKFRVLVAPRFGTDTAGRAIETIARLESLSDIAEAFDLPCCFETATRGARSLLDGAAEGG